MLLKLYKIRKSKKKSVVNIKYISTFNIKHSFKIIINIKNRQSKLNKHVMIELVFRLN